MSGSRQAFDQIVRQRRTCKSFDGRPIPKEDIQLLLEWATLSPNHHLNQPWRFRVCWGPEIEKFLQILRSKSEAQDWLTLQSAADRLKTAAAFIYVSILREKPAQRDEENFAAASAASQSILLGASALGYQSFWSTGRLMQNPTTQEILGVLESERFVGGLWLGHSPLPAPKPRRPLHEVSQWMDWDSESSPEAYA